MEELNVNDEMLPIHLGLFLSKLLHGEHNMTLTREIIYVEQDVTYIIHNEALLTQKHTLLPFVIKALTRKVEGLATA